jgi:hypothetical protein
MPCIPFIFWVVVQDFFFFSSPFTFDPFNDPGFNLFALLSRLDGLLASQVHFFPFLL